MSKLLERNFDFVTAVCRRILSDHAAAEDARQEVLFLAAHHIASFDQRSSFRTWIFVIARRVSLNMLRAAARRPTLADADIVNDVPSRSAATTAAVDTRLDIDAALAHLTPPRREVIVLRYLCDLSYDEIAEVTGVPLNTVRTRLRRALGDLHGLLGNSVGLAGVEER